MNISLCFCRSSKFSLTLGKPAPPPNPHEDRIWFHANLSRIQVPIVFSFFFLVLCYRFYLFTGFFLSKSLNKGFTSIPEILNTI